MYKLDPVGLMSSGVAWQHRASNSPRRAATIARSTAANIPVRTASRASNVVTLLVQTMQAWDRPPRRRSEIGTSSGHSPRLALVIIRVPPRIYRNAGNPCVCKTELVDIEPHLDMRCSMRIIDTINKSTDRHLSPPAVSAEDGKVHSRACETGLHVPLSTDRWIAENGIPVEEFRRL